VANSPNGITTLASTARTGRSEVSVDHQAGQEGAVHQPGSLLVLGQIPYLEALEERPEVRFGRIDAEEHLGRNVVVARGCSGDGPGLV
jgi:hypothetical protein